MLLSGAVFIDRSNNTAAVKSLQDASKTVSDNKVALWMFPEGTRSMREEPHMLPLKKGGFHLAIQSGIPIIPLVAENYWRLYRKGVFDEGKIRVRGKTTVYCAIVIKLTCDLVLKPIPTTGLTEADAGALALRVHEVMLAALKEISVVPESSQTRSSLTPISGSREQTPAPPPHIVRNPLPIFDDPVPSNITMPATTLENARAPSSTSLSSYATSENGQSSEHGTEEDDDMVLVPRRS